MEAKNCLVILGSGVFRMRWTFFTNAFNKDNTCYQMYQNIIFYVKNYASPYSSISRTETDKH